MKGEKEKLGTQNKSGVEIQFAINQQAASYGKFCYKLFIAWEQKASAPLSAVIQLHPP